MGELAGAPPSIDLIALAGDRYGWPVPDDEIRGRPVRRPAFSHRILLWNRLWSRLHRVQTVQIVLDETLLRATDDAARRVKLNRSALVREALREYLGKLRVAELERRDRQGFERLPDTADDLDAWERAAAWPDD